MSKRGPAVRTPKESPILSAHEAVGAILASEAMIAESPRSFVELLEAGTAQKAAAMAKGKPEPGCDRFLSYDSIRWRCACGASGPVGRTPDGMPHVDDEILRHKPGESKE